MEKALTQFAGRLRRAGLTVSPAEALDACRALTAAGLTDRTVFKDALRSTMIKRSRDIPVFDALFDLHFSRGPIPEVEEEAEDPAGDSALSESLAAMLDAQRPDLSPVTEMIMTGRFGPLARLLAGGGQSLGLDRLESRLQINFFMRSLRKDLDLERVGVEAENFLAEMERTGLDPNLRQDLSDYVDRNLNRFEAEIRALLERELANNRFLYLKRIEDENLAEKRLANLSPEEVDAMRPAVEKLARRLKERLSLKLRKAQRGRFDLKTTLRKNIGLGGPLPDLRFRRKKPAKPQVVVLCDVSNSVRNFARFTLLFLYTLKEAVGKVRGYIFVGDLAEVTDMFEKLELNEAVARAASAQRLTYVFRTDYGGALTQFAREHLNAVNSKTTVFILGDARNNFFEPRPEALEAISRRARRLIWLNPEPKLNWRLGDSAMNHYQPYCTKVVECGNLKQLSTIIEEYTLP